MNHAAISSETIRIAGALQIRHCNQQIRLRYEQVKMFRSMLADPATPEMVRPRLRQLARLAMAAMEAADRRRREIQTRTAIFSGACRCDDGGSDGHLRSTDAEAQKP